ncbi:Fascin-2 [Larimichthys crocea]|uniref:Uncharacterized protein n=1 Tax=Larimichthys crocea TaxID=215358 RepID=A0ACD3RS03_LARCR|nr:Fascin-2 [Larimichthys crocea]
MGEGRKVEKVEKGDQRRERREIQGGSEPCSQSGRRDRHGDVSDGELTRKPGSVRSAPAKGTTGLWWPTEASRVPLKKCEDEQLTLKLINRPMLILRGENGFICHHKNSNILDASRSVYDIFTLEFSNGAYHIKGVDGRFWYVNSSGLVYSDGEVPEDFSLELLEHGRLAIRGKNGKYLRGDQGGTLKGDGHCLSSSALWEY